MLDNKVMKGSVVNPDWIYTNLFTKILNCIQLSYLKYFIWLLIIFL